MSKIFRKLPFVLLAAFLAFSLNLSAYAQDTDTENPSDVENLQGTPLDGGARLTWDPATDDIGIEGYVVYFGLESVDDEGETYPLRCWK